MELLRVNFGRIRAMKVGDAVLNQYQHRACTAGDRRSQRRKAKIHQGTPCGGYAFRLEEEAHFMSMPRVTLPPYRHFLAILIFGISANIGG
jgi:hypothetical protein